MHTNTQRTHETKTKNNRKQGNKGTKINYVCSDTKANTIKIANMI